MSIRIQITPGSPAPIYQQITDQVRRAIITGELAVGDQLPSVRQLAQLLTINPNTVARAYNDLAQEGVVDAQKGVGAFIAQKRRVLTRSERLRRINPKINDLIQTAIALDFSEEELRNVMEIELSKYPVKESKSV